MMSQTVRDTFGLDEYCINEMKRLIISRFDTISSRAHAQAFGTDSLYDTMRENLCEDLGEYFLTLGKGSISRQCKTALTRLASGDEELRRCLTAQFAFYIYDAKFSDVQQKPHIFWSLADKTVYGDFKKVLAAVLQNPVGARVVNLTTRPAREYIIRRHPRCPFLSGTRAALRNGLCIWRLSAIGKGFEPVAEQGGCRRKRGIAHLPKRAL
jgi:hypothetical protein